MVSWSDRSTFLPLPSSLLRRRSTTHCLDCSTLYCKMQTRLSHTLAAAIPLCLFASAAAFWQLLCTGVAGIARINPIMSPGRLSGHVHIIKGSSKLAPSQSSLVPLTWSKSFHQCHSRRSAHGTVYFLRNQARPFRILDSRSIFLGRRRPSRSCIRSCSLALAIARVWLRVRSPGSIVSDDIVRGVKAFFWPGRF